MEQKRKSSIKSKRAANSRKIKKTNNERVEKYPGLWEIIEEKMPNDNEKGTAKLLEKYPDIMEKIEKKMKSEKLHQWVKEFAGIVHEGKGKH